MRRGRMFTGVLGVAAAFALLLATGALAATPTQIYRDYADNGRLDGNYSAADLRAAQQDASIQGYGGPVVTVVTPAAPEYCRNAKGQLLDRNGNVVSSTSQAAPAGSACREAAVAPAKEVQQAPQYCRNAQGQLLDRNGHVVSSTSQAAPAGSACREAVAAPVAKAYCTDSNGNLLDRNGNVVSSTSQAAPAGADCKRSAGVAPERYTAPAQRTKPVRSSATLPFTGAELGIFAVVGIALIASGFLLRLTARQRSQRQ